MAWIPGFTSFDDANSLSNRLLAFAAVANSTSTWAMPIALTVSDDLALHGGEDVVMERIVGQLAFVEGRRNAGAGLAAMGFQARAVVYQQRISSMAATGVTNDAFVLSDDMGKDNILWMDHLLVSPTAIGAAGAGYELMVSSLLSWTKVDIRVKRKLQLDTPLVFALQTCFPAGTTGADCRMLGGLRMLLKRPK